MPIYAYACSACGFRQDILQKLSDAPLTECPNCHQPHFSKQLTAPGFVLKGSGWYVTDFRDNGAKKAGDSAAKAVEPTAKAADSGGPAETGANGGSKPSDSSSASESSASGAASGASSAGPASSAGASSAAAPSSTAASGS